MAQNLQIDPGTKDYVVVNGSPVPSDRVFEACYYALLIPENNWQYGVAGQGSFIYTLEKIKRSSSVEQSFASFAQSALKTQVVDTGKASSVAITNTAATTTTSTNTLAVVPAKTQLSNQLNFVPV